MLRRQQVVLSGRRLSWTFVDEHWKDSGQGKSALAFTFRHLGKVLNSQDAPLLTGSG